MKIAKACQMKALSLANVNFAFMILFSGLGIATAIHLVQIVAVKVWKTRVVPFS